MSPYKGEGGGCRRTRVWQTNSTRATTTFPPLRFAADGWVLRLPGVASIPRSTRTTQGTSDPARFGRPHSSSGWNMVIQWPLEHVRDWLTAAHLSTSWPTACSNVPSRSQDDIARAVGIRNERVRMRPLLSPTPRSDDCEPAASPATAGRRRHHPIALGARDRPPPAKRTATSRREPERLWPRALTDTRSGGAPTAGATLDPGARPPRLTLRSSPPRCDDRLRLDLYHGAHGSLRPPHPNPVGVESGFA